MGVWKEIFPNKRPWGAPTDGHCYGKSRYAFVLITPLCPQLGAEWGGCHEHSTKLPHPKGGGNVRRNYKFPHFGPFMKHYQLSMTWYPKILSGLGFCKTINISQIWPILVHCKTINISQIWPIHCKTINISQIWPLHCKTINISQIWPIPVHCKTTKNCKCAVNLWFEPITTHIVLLQRVNGLNGRCADIHCLPAMKFRWCHNALVLVGLLYWWILDIVHQISYDTVLFFIIINPPW